MDIKETLKILSEEHTPQLIAALDGLGIPVKEGENLRSMSDILDDISRKWQETGREE